MNQGNRTLVPRLLERLADEVRLLVNPSQMMAQDLIGYLSGGEVHLLF
jgi:hypothetical protein